MNTKTEIELCLVEARNALYILRYKITDIAHKLRESELELLDNSCDAIQSALKRLDPYTNYQLTFDESQGECDEYCDNLPHNPNPF